MLSDLFYHAEFTTGGLSNARLSFEDCTVVAGSDSFIAADFAAIVVAMPASSELVVEVEEEVVLIAAMADSGWRSCLG